MSTYLKYTDRYCPYLEDGETASQKEENVFPQVKRELIPLTWLPDSHSHDHSSSMLYTFL